jgi:hypothetical protein
LKMFKYILFGILGGFFSLWGYVGAAIVGHEAAQTEALLLSLAYVGVICFLIFKDKPEEFAYVLVLPMFIVIGMHTIYAAVGYSILRWTPDTEVFTAECSKTEVKYIKSPSMPVRSIAYDWDSEEVPSFITYTNINDTRISDLRYSSKPNVDDQRFDFIIMKPNSNFGHFSSGAALTYLIFPKNKVYWVTSNNNADISVKYKTSPIEQSKKDSAIRYELTVSDRRNGDKLAYLRYVVDVKKQRACGLAGTGRVSDSQFIRKAIGF